MQRSGSNSTAYAMLTGTTILWGSSTIAIKMAVTDLPPFCVGAFRFALTSIILVCFLAWQEKGLFIPAKSDWSKLVLLGMVGIFGANITFIIGVHYSTATNGALIMAGNPIVISVFSALLLKERIQSGQLLGILLSFLGVIVVIAKGSWTTLLNLNFNIGDIILLANPVCWGFYTVLCKKVIGNYSALAVTTYATLIGTVFFLPLAIYELVWSNLEIHVTYSGWIALAYLGLIPMSLGNVWYNKGIAAVGANRTGIFMNGTPIVAMLLSALVLREKIALPQFLGAVMVIAGVYLNSLRRGVHNNLLDSNLKT